MTEPADPSRAGIAGDWHGNRQWAISAIYSICALLESPRIILQAGDFGVWRESRTGTRPSGRQFFMPTYLDLVWSALELNDAQLWFADGNHEDHPYLQEIADEQGWLPADGDTPRIRWLRRGDRWKWHGKTWLACGGAISVDKLLRTEGVSWFPGEEITDEQEERIIAGGPADVLLSHDAPSCEPLALQVPPDEWLPMIPRAEAHRERLQRICEAARPSHVFHGHYHMQREYPNVPVPWGACSFTALDMDGTPGNWGILDTRAMTMHWPGETGEIVDNGDR